MTIETGADNHDGGIQGLFSGLSVEQEQALSEFLENHQAVLNENEELRKQLQLAGEIQRGSMPEGGPVIEGYDTGALMIPSKDLGGDFFDFYLPSAFRKNPKKSEVGIAVADVVGKGAAAALLGAMTHALFHAETFRGGVPADVLKRINYNLVLSAKNTGLFVTALYGVLYPQNGKFEFARAGHVLPVVYDKAGYPAEIDLRNGQPLNVNLAPSIHEGEVKLEKGGKLFLITDGILEAPGSYGEQFGNERFDEIVRDNWNLPTQEICRKMLDAVCDHEGNPQNFSDDCAIIGISRF